jgi:tetratricopeptide (TPR) repeat protein
MKKFIVLLPLLIITGCGGCRERAANPGGGAQWRESDAKWQEELLTYAVENINQMEKFQTQETFFQVFRRIFSLQQSIANKDENGSTGELAGAWPESEILAQIINRLNQWIRSQPPPGDWRPDPLVSGLPEPLKELPLVKGLGGLEFSAFDAYALLESAYLRDVALWARGDTLDDLSRADNLFAWTVRNIQLEEDDKDRTPLFPWESLFFGRGTAMERAWIFITLARQQGLDAAVLAAADAAETTPIAGETKPLKPWCVAVMIDNNAYLFDPLLGMPIPGKGGVRRDAQGRLELKPAALAEIMADPELLKRLDIDSQKTYPFNPSDLRNLTVLIEASPASLSYRMKLIEAHLAGKQKMALTVSASAQAERWKSLHGIGMAEIWQLPYETIRRRGRLSASETVGQLGEYMRFYALPNAPLAKGRLMQLKGQFSGQDGATAYYQSARPPLEELGLLSQLPSNLDLDKIRQDLVKTRSDLIKANNDPSVAPSPFLQSRKQDLDERMANIDLAKMAKRMMEEYTGILIKTRKFRSEEEKSAAKDAFQGQAMQILFKTILFGKEDATYWLGLVAFDRGNYGMAEDYLSKMLLEKIPDSSWRHGALFNLAQTVEAAGQIDRAAMIYQADPEAPDNYGRQLRARWLLEKTEK